MEDKPTPENPNWDQMLQHLEAELQAGKLLTKEEQQELEELKQIRSEAAEALNLYYSFDTDEQFFELKERIEQKESSESESPKRLFKLWSRIGVAVSIVMTLSVAVYFYTWHQKTVLYTVQIPDQNDIAPGKNTATLTLANGKTVVLSGSKTGVVIDASKLRYSDGTDIDAPSKNLEKIPGYTNSTSSSSELNNSQKPDVVITTPRGGTYQVRLPDGSSVWLNAASSLRFPTKFMGDERRVELSGEAYFEISHNKKMPFIVKTSRQEVEVLGTHFNLNSYPDEAITRTTLLEGSVRVVTLSSSLHERGGHIQDNQIVTLKPGQQSVLIQDQFKVNQVDAEAVIAWKNGYFRFDDENLESIMLKVSRWYSVDVIYQKERLKKEPFAGVITRFTNVSELLKMLELTGEVKFKIENKTIVVMDGN